jgi:sugar phosphate isomerase/epimerase
MEQHWDAYCGLSLVHFLAFPECQSGDGSILETAEQVLLDDFFSSIEISRVNSPEVRRNVAELIAQTHAKVDFGAQPMILGNRLNLNSLNNGERNNARKALEPYIDQAAELGAARFVLLSGPDPGAPRRTEARHALVASLQCLAEHTHARKMSLMLETFDRENEKPLPALRKLKPYLEHVHVGNCVKIPGRANYGDSHPRFGFPGSENDVPQLVEFIEALFEVGYLGENPPNGKKPAVGFEIKPQPGESSTAILANLKRAWRQAWAMVGQGQPA